LRSVKVIQNDTIRKLVYGTVCYSYSIITLALPSIVCENLSKIARFFSHLGHVFDATVRGRSRRNIVIPLVRKN